MAAGRCGHCVGWSGGNAVNGRLRGRRGLRVWLRHGACDACRRLGDRVHSVTQRSARSVSSTSRVPLPRVSICASRTAAADMRIRPA
ncbi:hypothetical protein TB9_00530 [Xanthomonas perforans]|uniref:Uncharacterized protein n=1 Tax=Xanthomonas perforans TaxID=442694 RepID=A0ABR5ER00_XANPE|nr:hypothetical protein XP315_13630 [Xanthomonas perforans]TKA16729.1 hypothetical protein TP41_13800 [Xanthomonas euvesicatoria pv. citrumelonis]KLC05898.1 hypothetical protein XP420_13070 [Xanthomonas perforans]KLC12361.1 hypothetical protein XP4B_07940 [Xanthomonas perforans]KLC17676.1 hypothetical protein XP712_15850 [Xanthomonas perforans]